MQSTSHNFIVHSVVQTRINNLVQGTLEKEIVSRCVGGYSSPLKSVETIAKIRYRWSEYTKSYPDWNQSCQLLDDRMIRDIGWPLDTGNPGLDIPLSLLSAPWLFLACLVDYSSQESGEDKLKKLIQENNNLVSKKI
jgi:hypothetical protein